MNTFKRAIALMLIVVPMAASAAPSALQITGNALLAADWAQTRFIAYHPDSYRELNPILGDHPSVGRVNWYFAASMVAANVTSAVLPKRWRPYWWAAVIVDEGICVVHNHSIGIGMRF